MTFTPTPPTAPCSACLGTGLITMAPSTTRVGGEKEPCPCCVGITAATFRVPPENVRWIPASETTPPTARAVSEVLEELAARCEAASGPDRELDADIAVAVSSDPKAWVVRDIAGGIFTHKPGWWCDGENKSHLSVSYTASLDAAMTLVPEGWVVASLEWWPMRDRGGVCLREVKDFDALGGYGFGFDETCGDARANARTGPLALAAAALRSAATLARETEAGS